jgi:hypothetical protein
MFRFRSILTISVLILCAAFSGCRATNQFGSITQSGNSSVALAITGSPFFNVTVLSAEVTLTGAAFTPGNVTIFSGSTTVELTRLQTDIAYLATATNVAAGSYTGVTLTFANPKLTIENDTAATIGGCAVGLICTITPVSTILSTTVTIPTLPITANSVSGLLIDVNLDNLLSATLGTLGADFKAGATVSSFTPAVTGAPLVGAEDVVGQITSVDATHNTFAFQNAAGSFSLAVDSSTLFFPFPSSVCTTTSFACLKANQVLSVDIGIRADGTPVARNILFEDADNADAEVEGMITSTNVGSQQFTIVTLGESATVSGLQIGDVATVHYTAVPQTPFDIDFTHADTVPVLTTCCIFNAPADLSVGQQVSIRRNSTSLGNSITADRVRLRSSRISAFVGSLGSPFLNLSNFPSNFSGHGVTQLSAQTFSSTIYYEIGATINSSNIGVGSPISVRGPLFNASGGARNMLATKVVLKP